MAVVGANGAGAYLPCGLSGVPHGLGAGKSTLIKLLIGELEPLSGHVTRNGRLRMSVVYICGEQGSEPDLRSEPTSLSTTLISLRLT